MLRDHEFIGVFIGDISGDPVTKRHRPQKNGPFFEEEKHLSMKRFFAFSCMFSRGYDTYFNISDR